MLIREWHGRLKDNFLAADKRMTEATMLADVAGALGSNCYSGNVENGWMIIWNGVSNSIYMGME